MLLALRLGRWIDGLVDAYFGPPRAAELVQAEPRLPAQQLAEEAAALRLALGTADLEPQRVRWLDAQLSGLETTAARLAGEPMPWADEVERCFGIRPTPANEAELTNVHESLDAVLPGSGDLRGRYRDWNDLTRVQEDKILPALEALKDALRASAHAIVPLAKDETITYTLVEDKPWAAYNWYLGDFHSRVDVNVDLPMRLWALPLLAAHEAYPGHHTERVAKDQRLLRRNGWVENSVPVLTAPEALISEGIAMIALDRAFDDPHAMVSAILASVGIAYDPELMRVVYQAETAFNSVASSAAALLHGEERPREEVLEYICRWSLSSPELAQKTLSFIEDPTFRAYISSYVSGAALCARFVELHENGYERLLTEQLTTTDLLEATSKPKG